MQRQRLKLREQRPSTAKCCTANPLSSLAPRVAMTLIMNATRVPMLRTAKLLTDLSQTENGERNCLGLKLL